jgi:uncharacterized protein
MKNDKQSFIERILTGPFVTIFASVMTTFLAAAFFFKLSGPVPISVTQTSIEKQSSFDVTGLGEATAVPDEATISLGVIQEASTVVDAQNRLNTKINQIMEAVKDLRIDNKDIKTVDYFVRSNYRNVDYRGGEREISGYSANATIRVKFKDFDKLTQAIDKATLLGANQVGGINFGLSKEKEDEARKEAREQAVEEAKMKAEELAKLAGVKLGRIINVSENLTTPRFPLYAEAREMTLDSTQEPTQVEPGSTQVKVQVTLSYETL